VPLEKEICLWRICKLYIVASFAVSAQGEGHRSIPAPPRYPKIKSLPTAGPLFVFNAQAWYASILVRMLGRVSFIVGHPAWVASFAVSAQSEGHRSIPAHPIYRKIVQTAGLFLFRMIIRI